MLPQVFLSPQLTLPEPRVFHTATTALSSEQGWTQVTMFGGCPKWESGKSPAALQKLAKTTVLEFGEQNTNMTPASLCLPFSFCIEQ